MNQCQRKSDLCFISTLDFSIKCWRRRGDWNCGIRTTNLHNGTKKWCKSSNVDTRWRVTWPESHRLFRWGAMHVDANSTTPNQSCLDLKTKPTIFSPQKEANWWKWQQSGAAGVTATITSKLASVDKQDGWTEEASVQNILQQHHPGQATISVSVINQVPAAAEPTWTITDVSAVCRSRKSIYGQS